MVFQKQFQEQFQDNFFYLETRRRASGLDICKIALRVNGFGFEVERERDRLAKGLEILRIIFIVKGFALTERERERDLDAERDLETERERERDREADLDDLDVCFGAKCLAMASTFFLLAWWSTSHIKILPNGYDSAN